MKSYFSQIWKIFQGRILRIENDWKNTERLNNRQKPASNDSNEKNFVTKQMNTNRNYRR